MKITATKYIVGLFIASLFLFSSAQEIVYLHNRITADDTLATEDDTLATEDTNEYHFNTTLFATNASVTNNGNIYDLSKRQSRYIKFTFIHNWQNIDILGDTNNPVLVVNNCLYAIYSDQIYKLVIDYDQLEERITLSLTNVASLNTNYNGTDFMTEDRKNLPIVDLMRYY